MTFQQLRSLKSLVNARNSRKYLEPIEFWFPQMYKDGAWSCTLVFGKTLDDSELHDFVFFLYANNIHFFIGNLNEDMAIYVQ